MFPQVDIVRWRAVAPWADDDDVEQDLVITLALFDIFRDETLKAGARVPRRHRAPQAPPRRPRPGTRRTSTSCSGSPVYAAWQISVATSCTGAAPWTLSSRPLCPGPGPRAPEPTAPETRPRRWAAAFSDPATRTAATTPTSRSVACPARRHGRRVMRCGARWQGSGRLGEPHRDRKVATGREARESVWIRPARRHARKRAGGGRP